MSETWDVVVAGAGVGGLALATRLGRLGCRVVVVERRMPSPGAGAAPFRVGESLDWEAPIYLRRLEISLERLVLEGKATLKHGAIATAATQPGVEAAFGFSLLFRLLMALVGRSRPTFHVDRERLDQELLEAAHAAGVALIAGQVRAIDRGGDRVSGIVLTDGRRLEGRFYVDAAGSAGLFRKRLVSARTGSARERSPSAPGFPTATMGWEPAFARTTRSASPRGSGTSLSRRRSRTSGW